jgi:hypothetical protein
MSEITEEFNQNDLDSGAYVVRSVSGFIEMFFNEIEIKDDDFSVKKMKFLTKEVDGVEVITNISYDGVRYELSEINGEADSEMFSIIKI